MLTRAAVRILFYVSAVPSTEILLEGSARKMLTRYMGAAGPLVDQSPYSTVRRETTIDRLRGFAACPGGRRAQEVCSRGVGNLPYDRTQETWLRLAAPSDFPTL